MHPILTEARARDHQRELLHQAEEWRHTHPRQVTATTTPVLTRLRGLVHRLTQRRSRPTVVPHDPRPATLAPKEVSHDGRSLSRV